MIDSKRGYVALFTVMVLTFVLTVLSVTAGEAGFLARMNVTDAENRLIATHHARSCAAIALLYYAQDSAFAVPPQGIEQDLASGAVCSIDSLNVVGETVEIRASAQVGASTARTLTTAQRASLHLTQAVEI